jgi:hypothetical protein
MRRNAALALLLLPMACALPSNVSIANRVTVDGTAARFEQCGLSLRFAGTPRALYSSEASHYMSALGRTENRWQVDALVHQDLAISQTAICACRDAEFSDADIARSERANARNPNGRPLPVAQRPFARRVIGGEAPNGRAAEYVAEQALYLFPVAARSCIFIQGGKFGPAATDGLKAFFATVQPIGK